MGLPEATTIPNRLTPTDPASVGLYQTSKTSLHMNQLNTDNSYRGSYKVSIKYMGNYKNLNLKNGEGQKLRGNSKIHGGFVMFNFHFPKIPNVFIFMICGTSGNVKGPLKPLLLTLDPPSYEINTRKINHPFWEILFCEKLQNLGFKHVCRETLEIRLIKS